MADDQIGQRIGDYEILGELGNGGMGKVYKVRNVISDRVEAMKVLLPNLQDQKDLADRFLREIKVLASLNHPNIAALQTAFTANNQLVMIMEYVQGVTLAQKIEQGPVPIVDALNYIDAVLAALGYAHAHNVVHRDIKPGNIMITPDGIVKLMDFGIARSDKDSNLTATGTALGSLNYMPPEQIEGRSVDARSDIYSVGVTLYELLTGQTPFKGDSNYSVMVAHMKQEPRRPIELRPDLPAGLNEIILMALAKDPARRFQTAEAFRNAIASVRGNMSGVASGVVLPPVPISSGTPVAGTRPSTQAPARLTPLPGSVVTPGSLRPTPAPGVPVASGVQVPPPTGVAPPLSGPHTAPPQTIVAAKSSGSRGLYIALGAAIVLVALVAAGISVPKWLKARASERSSLPANQVSGGDAPNGNAAATGDGGAASNGAAPGAPGANSDGSNTVVNAPGVKITAGDSGATVEIAPTATTPGVNIKGSDSGASVNITPMGSNAPAPRAHVNRPLNTPPAQPPSNVAPAVPVAPAVDPAEVAAAEKQMEQLGTRASAAKASLATMQKSLSAQGLGLRGDIAGAESRMDMYIAKADAAMEQQDLARAKHYMELAEPEVEKIEHFLGR